MVLCCTFPEVETKVIVYFINAPYNTYSVGFRESMEWGGGGDSIPPENVTPFAYMINTCMRPLGPLCMALSDP